MRVGHGTVQIAGQRIGADEETSADTVRHEVSALDESANGACRDPTELAGGFIDVEQVGVNHPYWSPVGKKVSTTSSFGIWSERATSPRMTLM